MVGKTNYKQVLVIWTEGNFQLQ